MATVHGFIRHPDGSPALGISVQAIDKDLRSEQLLGETVIEQTSGRYAIGYTAEQFRRSEKKTADLIVRAFDAEGTLRAESEILFNARDEERVDLTLSAVREPPRPRLSELEALQESVETVREGVDYVDFSDEDLVFLTEEVIRGGILGVVERPRIRERLAFLRLGARFERDTDVLLTAFYGWFRQGLARELESLIETPVDRLRRALQRSIDENIIPDISGQITALLDRLRALRFTRGRLQSHHFTVQLIGVYDDGVEHALANYPVDVVDTAADPEEQALGATNTDSEGMLTLGFVLQADAPEGTSRRLELRIREEERTLAITGIDAFPRQTEVAVVRVPIPPDAREQAAIEELAPPQLSTRLRDRGIETLADLLANPDITDEEDPEALESLRAHAKWTTLAPELNESGRARLIENGILSPLDRAVVSRAAFVRDHHDELGGDADSYARYKANLDAAGLVRHQLNGVWINSVTTPDDEDDDPDIPTGVKDTLKDLQACGCKDCTSAVSPAAYLAHLLDWVLTHVKDGEAAVAFADLEDDLHQPFGRLPASCRAVEEEVRQVRLVVEALWRFTALLDRADLQMPTPFRNAYRHLRNELYRNMLTQLGTSFDQLRKATLTIADVDAAAEAVASQRAAVANLLGIDEVHLGDLFFNVEQPPISPTEDDLERLFSYKSTRAEDVFTAPARPELIDWQRERLEAIWQSQDWSLDAYRGEGRPAFVDPEIIDSAFLRTPLDENPAFDLLEARQSALVAHRLAMEAFDPRQNGLADLVNEVLGESLETLREFNVALQSADSAEGAIAQAQAVVAALHLTPAGFAHLMEVDARLQAEEPVGATDELINAAWNAVLDLLSRAHRHSLFPDWVEEEEMLGLILGPQTFWLPAAAASQLNPWQADLVERAAWEEALRRRSRPPVIDPDQIPLGHITGFRMIRPRLMHGAPLNQLLLLPGLRSVELWEARRAFIDGRLEALQSAEAGQPSIEARLAATLQASTLGIDLNVFDELAALEEQGTDSAPRLAQIGLTLHEYRFLADMHLLAQANSPISADDRAEIRAILVQGEKRREYAQWRLEEEPNDEDANGITLHPNRFNLPKFFEPKEDSPQNRWLHDAAAYQEWLTTLKARADQFDALEDALARAVGNAETAVLPLLRNILMMESPHGGDSFTDKAAWLDGRLLMDMLMDGCHMTTRVSQAIETLQRLVRGIYTQEHIEPLQHLTLDAVEDYENEWGTIGDYRDWRAVTLMYLFPENSLHLMPMPKQSEALQKLKSSLPSVVGPNQACEAAHEFSAYFRDVSTLKTQAACQALARLPGECKSGRSHFRVLVFLFARARETGHVYVSAFVPHYPKDLLYQWSRIKGAGEVEQIVGATPHTSPNGRRYIVLFVITEHAGERSLEFLRFDLDNLTWSNRKALNLPRGISRGFRVAAIQKRPSAYASGLEDFSPAADFPTVVAVEDSEDIIYIRRLDADAQDWESSGWKPLYGKRVVSAAFFDDPFRLAGVVQNDDKEYIVIIEKFFDRGVRYRTLFVDPHGRDDLRWRRVWEIDNYRGALGMPLLRHIAAFSNQGAFMRYRTIGPAGQLDGETVYSPWEDFDGDIEDQVGTNSIISHLEGRDEKLIRFIADFDEEWLQSRAGVSLDDIDLTGLEVPLFVPTEVGENNGLPVENANPLSPGDSSVQQESSTYTINGSLLDLLTLERKDFKPFIPGGARYSSKYYYLVQVLDAGVKEFEARMKSLGSADYLDTLGPWRLTDEHIRNLSAKAGDNLVKLVKRLAWNRIRSQLLYLHQWIRNTIDGAEDLLGMFVESYGRVAVKHRQGSELGALQSMLGSWFLPRLSGDGSFPRGPSAEQAVVLAQERATYITRFVRDDQQLVYKSHYPPARVTPDHDGPYDIAPQRDKNDLALRRAEIKSVYQSSAAALSKAALSARTLLKEAFNLAPVVLGHSLQRSGHYEEALAYFRLVFDDRQIAGERRVDFGLELERELPLDYDRAEEFLSDSANAHAIAATRKNTYTRQIVLLIVRCLIDYADALFTKDTASDNARARELYARALELLDLGFLKPGDSPCANIIGKLEVEVVEPGEFPLQSFAVALHQITDPVRLGTLTERLVEVNTQTGSVSGRLTQMRELVVTALEAEPPTKSQAQIRQHARANLSALENLYLAHVPARTFSRTVMQRRRDLEINRLVEATNISEMQITATALPWLRERRPQRSPDTGNLMLVGTTPISRAQIVDRMRADAPLVTLNAMHLTAFAPATGVSFQFCIPQNPVIQALRGRAEANLLKLRSCRNIAGFVRPLDPYGAPIGVGAGMVSADGRIFSGVIDAPPTIYRFAALIVRAKELVNLAQQIEAGYQHALERAEQEQLSVLQAEQHFELAQARVTLQDLRINQANQELGLVQMQRGSAVLREGTFSSWIAGGKNEHERGLLDAYRDAGAAQQAANAARTVGAVAGITAAAVDVAAQSRGIKGNVLALTSVGLRAVQAAAAVAEGVASGFAINAQTRAQVASFEASFERRNDEWELQRGLAALDIAVADQQTTVARSQVEIVQQERVIAGLEHTHAADVLRFLTNRVFNEEMYRWIATVLEDVYRFFLQEATSIARLAERQLAFERQQAPLKVVQTNYWTSAVPTNALSGQGNADRLGLTGSARLLKDIYQLDSYAFETRQRKQSLTFTLDLAELYPLEFQRFREIGVLVFETPLSLIDRQMPGYYLCLIHQVSIAVVALVPPTYGIRASLSSAGISRAVVGGDTFQTVTIRNLPERIALTAPTASSSIIELEPDAQSLLHPFEGSGFDTLWELRMLKAANPWDYNTMATILITVEMSALHSFDYERQVIERLDRKVSFERAFDFRQVFADAFYDLNNPDLTDTPMSVRFDTRRGDFPPNLTRLRIEHVVLYFIRKNGEILEQEVHHLHFTPEGAKGALGGPASTVDGRISTRSGNGASWLPMLGVAPAGRWELAFNDNPPTETQARDRFTNEQIENLLLVLTVSGETPSYVT